MAGRSLVRNPAVVSDGVPAWATFVRSHHKAGFNLPRNRCPVQPAGEDGWRFTAKCRSARGFARAAVAMRCSGFVPIAIADTAIAARRAAPRRGSSSAVAPTAGTSRAWKDA
jgi:hypothetical protein